MITNLFAKMCADIKIKGWFEKVITKNKQSRGYIIMILNLNYEKNEQK